jgi:hypothetical protein
MVYGTVVDIQDSIVSGLICGDVAVIPIVVITSIIAVSISVLNGIVL